MSKGTNWLDARGLFLDDPVEGKQRETRPFPVQLEFPYPHESLLSYVARVGTENGRDYLDQVLRISFPGQLIGCSLPFSGIDLEPLSQLLNVPLDILRAKLYTGPSNAASPRRVAWLNGQEIPRKCLSTGRRRIAPMSVAEHGYHRSIWDVLPLTCCVETGEKLIDRCVCGRILTWGKNNLQNCGDPACRFDLRETIASFVEPEQLRQIRVLASLYSPNVKEQQAARRQIPAELSDLSSAELLELIILFAVARSDPIGSIARRRRMSLCNGNFVSWTTEELVAGIEIVLGFPAKFDELLDMMIERAPERPGRWSCEKYVGVLIELTEQKPFSVRVVNKFRSYIPDALNRRSSVTLNTKVKTREPKYLHDTISITEACKRYRLYGLNYNRISKLTKVPGFVKTPGGLARMPGVPVLLDARQVGGAVQRFWDLVSFSNAALEMGLSVTNLRRIISDGFLSYADGPEVALCWRGKSSIRPASYLYRSRIKALFEQIEAKARKLMQPVHLVNGVAKVPDGTYLGLKAVLEGKISVGVDTNQTSAVHRLLVEESEFRSYAYSKVPKGVCGDTITLQMATEILKLRWSVARELLERSGIYIEKNGGRKSVKSRRVRRVDVLRIAEAYISEEAAAEFLSTFPGRVGRRVSRLGVRPILILEKSGAVFYDRHEIFRKCECVFARLEASRAGISVPSWRRRVPVGRRERRNGR